MANLSIDLFIDQIFINQDLVVLNKEISFSFIFFKRIFSKHKFEHKDSQWPYISLLPKISLKNFWSHVLQSANESWDRLFLLYYYLAQPIICELYVSLSCN